ncbi:hypothetical protein, partial [Phaeospirillum tilakii]
MSPSDPASRPPHSRSPWRVLLLVLIVGLGAALLVYRDQLPRLAENGRALIATLPPSTSGGPAPGGAAPPAAAAA